MISIIIPIRNEENFIRQTIDSILAQDYPQSEVEIIVADGMSTDTTRQIVTSYQQIYPNIKLVDNPGKIVPTGFNHALRQSDGDIVIRIDGHTIIAHDYISKCVETLLRTGTENVGGKMTAVGQNEFAKAVAVATSSPFGVGGSKFHYSNKEEWVDSVYMGAWPRRVFEKIGLFDEELVRDQDDEFNYRLRENGGRILLSPEIKSEYSVRSSPKSLWKQYFQYGYWKVRVLQKHPMQMSLRHFVPPAFVFGLVVSLILAIFTWFGRSLFTAIVSLYMIANLCVSIYSSAQKEWGHVYKLPIIYTILHISYGLGFFVGLVKFANRWRDKTGKVSYL